MAYELQGFLQLGLLVTYGSSGYTYDADANDPEPVVDLDGPCLQSADPGTVWSG